MPNPKKCERLSRHLHEPSSGKRLECARPRDSPDYFLLPPTRANAAPVHLIVFAPLPSATLDYMAVITKLR